MDSCKGMIDIKNTILDEWRYLVILAILLIGMFVFVDRITLFEALAQTDNINSNQDSTNNLDTPSNKVPSIMVTFNDLEVEMDPFIHIQKNITTKIGAVNTYETRSNEPEITLKQGDIISLIYEKEPLETKVYLINYDTEDKNEIYSVPQLDDSEFEIPEDGPQGLTNLEIRGLFDNNERIIYTASVFVEPEQIQLGSEAEDNDDNNNEDVEEEEDDVEEDEDVDDEEEDDEDVEEDDET